MNIKNLKDQIKDVPDDTEVFIRSTRNICGNIIEAEKANKSTYGFFGKSLDCIIIEPSEDYK